MKLKTYIIFGLFFFLQCAVLHKAEAVSTENRVPVKKVGFTDCIDKNLGYKIKCSPNWNLSVKSSSISLLIDESPGRLVNINISRSEETGLHYSDLTPSTLQYVYDYADHFKVGKERIANRRAIRVEANSAVYPGVKFLDYYLLKDTYLYRISFSVNSDDHFESFKPLFEALASSFEFYEFQTNTLTKTGLKDTKESYK